MKIDYIELHRGNNELIRLDFKTNLYEVYNENFDVPIIGLIKLFNNIYSGIKIYSDNNKHKIIKQLRRFYRHKNNLIKLFNFSVIEELHRWEKLDDFKYMLLSKSDEQYKLSFKELWSIPLKLKNILKLKSSSIEYICINLDQISDNDKKLNNIICEDGTVLNIDRLCKEFNLLLDCNKTNSGNREYIVEFNCIDDTLFILDDNSFYIIYLKSNTNINNIIFSNNMYGETNKIDEKVALDLYYTRLCVMTNNFRLIGFPE